MTKVTALGIDHGVRSYIDGCICIPVENQLVIGHSHELDAEYGPSVYHRAPAEPQANCPHATERSVSHQMPHASIIDIEVGIVVSLAADVLPHVRRCTIHNVRTGLLLFLDDP